MTLMEEKRVRSVRVNAAVKRGLSLILRELVNDFDNGFDGLFPEATDSQIMDICAAIEWMEQHSDDIYE